jgi:hypothetical protein
MDLNTDYILPVELTGFIREALVDIQLNQFILSQWLPNVTVEDIDYRVTAGQLGLARAGVFRTYNAESPIGGREGLKRLIGELPPISEKILLDEYTRLRLRRLRTTDVMVQSIYNDALIVARSIAARMEMARGQVLVNGALTFNENGVIATVNFGRDSAYSVTPAILWSASNATPVSDLLSWQQTYIQTGAQIGSIVTSRRVLAVLMRSTDFRQTYSTLAGEPSIVSQAAINAVLEAFGLPPITLYDAQVSVAGSATRIVPDDKVLMLPAPGSVDDTSLGQTVWGIPAEAMDPGYGLEEGQQGGIVGGAYSDNDPPSLWTKASAIGMPVLANPDLAMVADVL